MVIVVKKPQIPNRIIGTGASKVYHDQNSICVICQKKISQYNPNDRCYLCLQKYGPPPVHETTFRQRKKKDIHLPNCECHIRRTMMLDEKGNPITRGKKIKRINYSIIVTCPECKKSRKIIYIKPLCLTNYQVKCHLCASTKENKSRHKND